ncbi:hypothetical protein M0804_007048 [Polistes exclamans]|nr:hypothetical protein M0804_007048 [Polistes exclamans]
MWATPIHARPTAGAAAVGAVPVGTVAAEEEEEEEEEEDDEEEEEEEEDEDEEEEEDCSEARNVLFGARRIFP